MSQGGTIVAKIANNDTTVTIAPVATPDTSAANPRARGNDKGGSGVG